MNILVTIDKNYADVLVRMLKTLAASNKCDFDVYIAHSSLTFTELTYIQKKVDCSRIKMHPIKIPPQLFDGAHLQSVSQRKLITGCCFLSICLNMLTEFFTLTPI